MHRDTVCSQCWCESPNRCIDVPKIPTYGTSNRTSDVPMIPFYPIGACYDICLITLASCRISLRVPPDGDLRRQVWRPMSQATVAFTISGNRCDRIWSQIQQLYYLRVNHCGICGLGAIDTIIWLVLWLPSICFSHIYWESSSQLTKSYFSEGFKPSSNR